MYSQREIDQLEKELARLERKNKAKREKITFTLIIIGLLLIFIIIDSL